MSGTQGFIPDIVLIFFSYLDHEKGHVAALVKVRRVCRLFGHVSEWRIGMIVRDFMWPNHALTSYIPESRQHIAELCGYNAESQRAEDIFDFARHFKAGTDCEGHPRRV